MTTTYRQLLLSLTEEQLDQPVRYLSEEGEVHELQLTITKEDIGRTPDYEEGVSIRSSFEDEIAQGAEFEVTYPSGTAFLFPYTETKTPNDGQ